MRRVKHLPISDDELKRLMSQWRRKGDTNAAIVAGTFLEDRIGFAIKAHFVELPDKGNSENTLTASGLFDGYGPLASFSLKLTWVML
jgi:hypothetical protein